MKENEFISALNKRSDTQELFNTEKSSIKHSTESSIISSDKNENFNSLSDRLVFKTVKSSKQLKKRDQLQKNSLLKNKIISTTDDQISDSVVRETVQLH